MKLFDLIKKSALLAVCPALLFSSVHTYRAPAVQADSEYEIILSAETVSVAENSFSSNRKVDVNISVEHNPGFSEMYVILEKPADIQFYSDVSPVSGSGIHSGVKNEYLDDSRSIVLVTIPSNESDTTDGNIAVASFRLPDSAIAGGSFEVKLLDMYENPDREIKKEAGIKKGGNVIGKDCIRELRNGTVRITEAKTTEPPATSAPEQSKEPEAPEHHEQDNPPQDNGGDNNSSDNNNSEDNNNNDNNNSNDNNSQETQAPEQNSQPEQSSSSVSAVTGTSVSDVSSSAPSVSQVPQTAVTEKNVSSSAVSKTTKTEITKKETGISSDTTDEEYDFKPDRTIEIILIILIVVVAVAGIFTIMSILKNYKKNNK